MAPQDSFSERVDVILVVGEYRERYLERNHHLNHDAIILLVAKAREGRFF